MYTGHMPCVIRVAMKCFSRHHYFQDGACFRRSRYEVNLGIEIGWKRSSSVRFGRIHFIFSCTHEIINSTSIGIFKRRLISRHWKLKYMSTNRADNGKLTSNRCDVCTTFFSAFQRTREGSGVEVVREMNMATVLLALKRIPQISAHLAAISRSSSIAVQIRAESFPVRYSIVSSAQRSASGWQGGRGWYLLRGCDTGHWWRGEIELGQ
jgi:hypothetical protein